MAHAAHPPEPSGHNGGEHSPGLTDMQLRVLKAVEERGPLQAVEIASVTRLTLDVLLPILQELTARGYVDRQDPEPAHDRFSIHLEGLEKELA